MASGFTKPRLSVRLARRSFTLPVRFSGVILSVPKTTSPFRMMETSRASSLSASAMGVGLLTWAMSTLIPCCNMGVTTMKIISNTSITSTMGVTLISELILAPSFRFAKAITYFLPLLSRLGRMAGTGRLESGGGRRGLSPAPEGNSLFSVEAASRQLASSNVAPLQEVIDQFARGVVHLHVEGFDPAGQVVEHHNGRDGYEQPDSRGYQRFCDTASDRRQTCGLLFRDTSECIQDAHHCSEQPDERGGRTDSGQAAQAALEFGVDNGFGALQCALGRFNGLARNGAGTVLVGFE